MDDFYRAPTSDQVKRLNRLAVAALQEWGVTDCEPQLLKYRENAVYKVRGPDGRPAALRLHRSGYHSDAELTSELSWMEALDKQGIAVPKVIPAKNNRCLVTVGISGIPEARQVDMLEWLEGDAFGSLETGLNNGIHDVRGAFALVGQLAGKMHNQVEGWPLPQGFTRHAWDIDGLLGEQPFWGRFWDLASLTSSEKALLQGAGARARQDLLAYGRSPGTYGLIHADMLTDNMILAGHHIKVLDFDDSGFGWHLFDLATILLFLRSEDCYDQVLEGVITGYRAIRSLPDEQLSHLPLFFLVRSFTYLGWVHTRFETPAAQELAPMLTDVACTLADEYMQGNL